MNLIGIILVLSSLENIYADFYKARRPNGPSMDIEQLYEYSDVHGFVHSAEELFVNLEDTSIEIDYSRVDDRRILAKAEQIWRESRNTHSTHLLMDNRREQSNNNDEQLDNGVCAKIITKFFSNCGDCFTYLDYAKYILLYVVYVAQTTPCIKSYINYVYNAIEIMKYGFLWNKDPIRVTSPQHFCDRLVPGLEVMWGAVDFSMKVKRSACLEQMQIYFGMKFSLKHKQTAMQMIFYRFDLVHIRNQPDSEYIQGYIKHVKNRFYYNAKEKLPAGERLLMFCHYNRNVKNRSQNTNPSTSAN